MKKPIVGVFGISGCAGCLLTILYEDAFKQMSNLLDLRSFPLVKEDRYKGDFDYVFIEGTVCSDEDIIKLNELRNRAKKIVALGACSTLGGVPSIKNFMDQDKTMRLIYPKTNKLKSSLPQPIDMHIKVDYYLPQCPPSKKEILDFVQCILTGREFKPYTNPVCLECRNLGNKCLLEEGKLCLGPITNGGCNALCPSNNTTCYGCRGPCKDANLKAFLEMIEQKGYTEKQLHDKMKTFAGLQFQQLEGEDKISTWLEG